MINLILAVSKNGVIGKDGSLPWRIPEDLKAFKRLTMDGVLFVGKKTASTLPPLKNREVAVLSRDTFPTLADINNNSWPGKSLWIIGGSQIYNAALDMGIVDRVYLTMIDRECDGDTFFDCATITNNPEWHLTSQEVLRESDPLVTLQVWDRV